MKNTIPTTILLIITFCLSIAHAGKERRGDGFMEIYWDSIGTIEMMYGDNKLLSSSDNMQEIVKTKSIILNSLSVLYKNYYGSSLPKNCVEIKSATNALEKLGDDSDITFSSSSDKSKYIGALSGLSFGAIGCRQSATNPEESENVEANNYSMSSKIAAVITPNKTVKVDRKLFNKGFEKIGPFARNVLNICSEKSSIQSSNTCYSMVGQKEFLMKKPNLSKGELTLLGHELLQCEHFRTSSDLNQCFTKVYSGLSK